MKALQTWLSAAVLFGFASSAMAVPATWTDEYTPNNAPLKMSGSITQWSFQSHSWTFDLADNGFDVGIDSVSSYKIKLFVSDDGDRDRFLCLSGCEFAFYHESQNDGIGGIFEELLNGYQFEVDFNRELNGLASGIAKLNLDGTLNVSLTAESGDFWFHGAELVAEGVDVADVPEPATLALLGVGLVGLGAARRRSLR